MSRPRVTCSATFAAMASSKAGALRDCVQTVVKQHAKMNREIAIVRRFVMPMRALQRRDSCKTLMGSMTDSELVQRVRGGDTALFEVLMRRHNQRVYRVARAVIKDETEAEDVMQQAYINAFLHLDQFQDRAQFSTWLTRITI